MQLKKASALEKTAAVLLVAAAFTVFTVYDIEREAFYSVTVSASESSDTAYTDYAAEEGTDYAEYVMVGTTIAMEEIDRALNSGEIAVEEAPLAVVEIGDAFYSSDTEIPVTLIEAAAAENTSETTYTIVTKMYAVTTSDGTVFYDYPENYPLYYYDYEDRAVRSILTDSIFR